MEEEMKHIPPEMAPKLKPVLTPEQIQRRKEVAERAKIIQDGVKPKDGMTFGKKA